MIHTSAWLMWLAVHIMYIVGFKSRFTTVLDWTVNLLSRDRSERTTTSQQVLARKALQHPEAAADVIPAHPGPLS